MTPVFWMASTADFQSFLRELLNFSPFFPFFALKIPVQAPAAGTRLAKAFELRGFAWPWSFPQHELDRRRRRMYATHLYLYLYMAYIHVYCIYYLVLLYIYIYTPRNIYIYMCVYIYEYINTYGIVYILCTL